MLIKVIRKYKKSEYTIGKMYVNGEYFCDTLEDKDRGLTQSMSAGEIDRIKVYGQTAIPAGKYKVLLTYSNKFKRVLPQICNVKGFLGVRIHSGNTNKDTLGCILVGKNRNVGMVNDSRVTEGRLMRVLNSHKEEDIELLIE